MTLIPRQARVSAIRAAFARTPIVSILGPRQSGKTTLARTFARGRRVTFFDLENPSDVARLSVPMTALEPLRGLDGRAAFRSVSCREAVR